MTDFDGKRRGAFHSKKSHTSLAKILCFLKKIRKNPIVLKKSRTLFLMSEMPLGKRFMIQVRLLAAHKDIVHDIHVVK